MNANVDYIIKTAIGEFNYLDYEGQHITATNSIEGHARSAILKGQTLVNLVTHSKRKTVNVQNLSESDGRLSWNTTASWGKVGFTIQGKANTTYCIRYSDKHETLGFYVRFVDDVHGAGHSITVLNSICRKFTTDETGIFTLTLEQGSATTDSWIKNFMLLEYVEGMENWDIPYFKGMQSVKMPILSTVGKNLIDYKNYNPKANTGQNPQEIIIGEQELSFNVNKPSWISLWYDLCLEKGEKYTLSYDTNLLKCFIFKSKVNTYVNSEVVATATDINATEDKIQKVIKTFTAPSTGFIRVRLTSEQKVGKHILQNFQIEQGTTATSYEPHKSSILSTPEEVVLRSLPNGVCDTLNVETGELTQRIGEIVLDGSESWTKGGWWEPQVETMGFEKPLPVKSESSLSNAMTTGPFHRITSTDKEYIAVSTEWGCLGIRIARSKLPTEDIEGLKTYLSQNPITVQYELETPIVKTIDLSDNHVYSYKDVTHYDCSSAEGSLVPTLSVKVPTDVQLTIQEQKATTQTLLIKNMDLQQSIKEVQAMNLAFNTALYNSFNSIREEVEDIKKHVSTNENLEGSF